MAKRSGFPGGGMGNMQNLMKQAQKMQKQMEEQAAALSEKEFISSSGGGAVKIKANGEKRILSVEIDREVIDPEDKEMLEDLVLSAINDVLAQIDKEATNNLSGLTGGMGGLGGFPF